MLICLSVSLIKTQEDDEKLKEEDKKNYYQQEEKYSTNYLIHIKTNNTE